MARPALIITQKGPDSKWSWKSYGHSGDLLGQQEGLPDWPDSFEAIINWHGADELAQSPPTLPGQSKKARKPRARGNAQKS